MEERARSNPQLLIEVSRLNQMIDEEIARFQIEPESSTQYNIIQYKQPDPSLHWSQG